MHKNIDVWDQSDFMRGLNESFALSAQNRYATAIVLSFDRITGRLAFSNAGHLPPLWYHARHKKWGWLREDDFPQANKALGLPIGLIPGTDYLQTVVNLEPCDLLVLYTDGVTEAENKVGQSLDREQLLKWAREAPIDSPESLGRALLRRLESFQGRCRTDDETLVVLQRDKASLFASPGDAAMNHSVPPRDEPEIRPVDGRSRSMSESDVGSVHNYPKDGAKRLVVRETDCFERRNGEWKLIHQHDSVPSGGDWDGKVTMAHLTILPSEV